MERLPDLMIPAHGEYLKAAGPYRRFGQRVSMSPRLRFLEQGKTYRLLGFYPPLNSEMKTFFVVEEGSLAIGAEDITRKCLEMWLVLTWVKINDKHFLEVTAMDGEALYETRVQILKELFEVIEEKVTWRTQAEEIRMAFLNTIRFFEVLGERFGPRARLYSFLLEKYRQCHESDSVDYDLYLQMKKAMAEDLKMDCDNSITIITTFPDRSTVKDALWAAMYAFDSSQKDKARKMSELLDQFREEDLRVIHDFGLAKLKKEDTWEKEMAKNVEHIKKEMSKDKLTESVEAWMKNWLFACPDNR